MFLDFHLVFILFGERSMKDLPVKNFSAKKKYSRIIFGEENEIQV